MLAARDDRTDLYAELETVDSETAFRFVGELLISGYPWHYARLTRLALLNPDETLSLYGVSLASSWDRYETLFTELVEKSERGVEGPTLTNLLTNFTVYYSDEPHDKENE